MAPGGSFGLCEEAALKGCRVGSGGQLLCPQWLRHPQGATSQETVTLALREVAEDSGGHTC